MELAAVARCYARWAPIYDATFGAVTERGRNWAVDYISRRGGRVLEVGVGTGMALVRYGQDVEVVGIDYSPDMLAKAEAKVRERRLSQIKGLMRMDARRLEFPNGSFDTVAAMHVLSVVPDPHLVVAEAARVLRPGGELVVVNHLARDRGALGLAARASARFSDILGWHSDFRRELVVGQAGLDLVEERNFPPFGMMSFLVLRKPG